MFYNDQRKQWYLSQTQFSKETNDMISKIFDISTNVEKELRKDLSDFEGVYTG